jgi:hypothetical protein
LVLQQETDGFANSVSDIAKFLLKLMYQASLPYDILLQLPVFHFPPSRRLGDLIYLVSQLADLPPQLVVFSL